MSQNVERRKILGDLIPGLLAATILIGILYKILFGYWFQFQQVCPNQDVLSWDANLRLSQAIDQLRDIKSGNLSSGLFPFLHAPTWPPFRGILSVLYGLLAGGPSTGFEVLVGFAFFILFVASVFYIASRWSGSVFFGAGAGFLIVVLILQSSELLAYILSAMLETQGMFFTLWTFYFIYKLYANDSGFKTRDLFLAATGLFFTKYPYGIMLVIGLVLFELILHPADYIKLARFAFENHYGWIRRVLLALIPMIFLGLVLSRYMDLGVDLSGRTGKKIIVPVLVITFFDFVYMTWRFRKDLPGIVARPMVAIYQAVILPAGIWMMVDPDRIMSIVDSQQHVQDSSRSFFISLFTSVFEPGYLFFFIFFAGVISYAGILILRNKSESLKKNPEIILPGIILTQFLILEFLTGNKQLRHIYHLVPVILIMLLILVYRFQASVMKNKKIQGLVTGSILVILGIVSGSQSTGLFGAGYLGHRPICYTGEDPSVLEPARWMASHLEPDQKYIVVNEFHQQVDRGPGSLLASDMDLMGRMKTWPAGDYRNDSKYRWKTWSSFSRVLVLSNECDVDRIELDLANRLEQTKSKLENPKMLEHPRGNVCMVVFDIL